MFFSLGRLSPAEYILISRATQVLDDFFSFLFIFLAKLTFCPVKKGVFSLEEQLNYIISHS